MSPSIQEIPNTTGKTPLSFPSINPSLKKKEATNEKILPLSQEILLQDQLNSRKTPSQKYSLSTLSITPKSLEQAQKAQEAEFKRMLEGSGRLEGTRIKIDLTLYTIFVSICAVIFAALAGVFVATSAPLALSILFPLASLVLLGCAIASAVRLGQILQTESHIATKTKIEDLERKTKKINEGLTKLCNSDLSFKDLLKELSLSEIFPFAVSLSADQWEQFLNKLENKGFYFDLDQINEIASVLPNLDTSPEKLQKISDFLRKDFLLSFDTEKPHYVFDMEETQRSDKKDTLEQRIEREEILQEKISVLEHMGVISSAEAAYLKEFTTKYRRESLSPSNPEFVELKKKFIDCVEFNKETLEKELKIQEASSKNSDQEVGSKRKRIEDAFPASKKESVSEKRQRAS